MGIYSTNLPQLKDQLFITDAGMETVLIFHQNIEVPEFASYDLLRSQQGYQTLYDYYQTYASMAQRFNTGLVLDTPTWRANGDWGAKLGDSPEALSDFNQRSVNLLEHIRNDYATETSPIVISGCLGPRGDGYVASDIMTATEAEKYHSTQIATFANTIVDMISAYTLNYIEEAIGITKAAQAYNLPVCISFTVETDGRLPTGESLSEAITAVDQATDTGPAYYMINCAHPSHFDHLFADGDDTLHRIKGLSGNASRLSHAELDESEVLDEGNPEEFGLEMKGLRSLSPNLTVLGGCCGTDHRHIEQICANLAVA